MPRVRGVIFRFTSLLFVVGVACGSDDRHPGLSAPNYNGTIEGRIVVVDGPVVYGSVTATSVGPTRGEEITATAWADSAGAYTLSVPFGQYQLTGSLGSAGYFAYRATGPVISWTGDVVTLLPGRESIRADFVLGGAEIVIATPPVLEGENNWLQLELRPPGSQRSYAQCEGHASGGEARFGFPGLCPGRYVVRLRTRWQEEIPAYRAWLDPGSWAPPGDTLIVVVSSGYLKTVPLHLPQPAVLRGKVESVWRGFAGGTGALDALHQVEAYGSDSTADPVAHTQVRADGSFRFVLFYPAHGPLRLAYQQASEADRQWLGGVTFAEATPWEIASGRETVVPTIADAGIVLRVSVPEPQSRFLLSVTAHDVRGRKLTKAQWGSGGNVFAASVLAERTVYLRMDPLYGGCYESWLPCWYPGVDSMSQATPVSLRDGEFIDLETTVVRGGVIEGEFRMDPGSEAERTVYLVPAADSMRTTCSANLAADAVLFRFRGLVDGPYLLFGDVRDPSRWSRSWYPGTTWAGRADTVWVRGHAIVGGVTWTAR